MDELTQAFQKLDVDGMKILIKRYFSLLENYNFFQEDLEDFDKKWLSINSEKKEYMKSQIHYEMYTGTSELFLRDILYEMEIEEDSHFFYLEMLLDHMVNVENLV